MSEIGVDDHIKRTSNGVKICICATGPNLDSRVSPVFGRCPYFLIVDSETEESKAIPNSALQSGRGAGVAASQTVVSEKGEAVICGDFGPNAFSVLQMSGIKIYPGASGLTVREAVEKFNNGELKEMKVSSASGNLGPPGRGFGFRRRGRM